MLVWLRVVIFVDLQSLRSNMFSCELASPGHKRANVRTFSGGAREYTAHARVRYIQKAACERRVWYNGVWRSHAAV